MLNIEITNNILNIINKVVPSYISGEYTIEFEYDSILNSVNIHICYDNIRRITVHLKSKYLTNTEYIRTSIINRLTHELVGLEKIK